MARAPPWSLAEGTNVMRRRRPTIPSGWVRRGLSIDTAEMLVEVPCAGRAFAQLTRECDDVPPRIHSCWKSSSSGETADRMNASMPNPPSKIATRPCRGFLCARITYATAPRSKRYKLRGAPTQKPFSLTIQITPGQSRSRGRETTLKALDQPYI